MPTLLGILPYSGVAFAINEQSKRQVRPFREYFLIALIGLDAQLLFLW